MQNITSTELISQLLGLWTTNFCTDLRYPFRFSSAQQNGNKVVFTLPGV